MFRAVISVVVYISISFFFHFVVVDYLLFAIVYLLCIGRYLSASGGGFIGGPFLLHSLVFRESKSHPLRHFDVPTGAIFLGIDERILMELMNTETNRAMSEL